MILLREPLKMVKKYMMIGIMENHREEDKNITEEYLMSCGLWLRCHTPLEIVGVDECGNDIWGCPDIEDCGYQEGD
jgi:hypothetical protein